MTAPIKPSHADIFRLLQDLGEKVDELAHIVGKPSDDGATGTGLTGRIMRTEAKVLAYDRLKGNAMTAMATAGVFLAIIWWLIKDRIAGLFGVSGS
jgi:hypothetical protein